jgi:hypothetical protein
MRGRPRLSAPSAIHETARCRTRSGTQGADLIAAFRRSRRRLGMRHAQHAHEPTRPVAGAVVNSIGSFDAPWHPLTGRVRANRAATGNVGQCDRGRLRDKRAQPHDEGVRRVAGAWSKHAGLC